MLVGKVISSFKKDGKKVRIRYPRIEDVDDLLKLINSLVKENAYISMEKKLKRKDEVGWLSGALEKIENRKFVMLVLEVNGKVVGNCETTPKDRKEEHVAGMGISIRKEYRGSGLGEELTKTLINESKKRFPKLKIIVLNVFSNNKAAINLYKKLGFKKVGELKKGFKHKGKYMDKISMAKYLE